MKNQLSIIIPAYNAQNTIKKCIDSRLLQKDCSFEIIVVDDGSTDNTAQIVSDYKIKL